MSSNILEERLELLRKNDEQAIKDLVTTHTPVLYAAALGMGFSSADAEELVQDTFVAFLDALDRFEQRSKIKTYLFGILYNKASELRRHNVREMGTDKIDEILEQRFDARGLWMKPTQGPEDDVLNQELAKWIEECSEGLTVDQRTAFYLREVEGETTESLCKILSVAVTHLGVILYRARNKMMLCLEEKMGKKP